MRALRKRGTTIVAAVAVGALALTACEASVEGNDDGITGEIDPNVEDEGEGGGD